MANLDRLKHPVKIDGQDHIRIAFTAETHLGKILAPKWVRKFFVPELGTFRTPACFANWLVSGDEAARHDTRFPLKERGRHYRDFILYGKYHQLCKMRAELLNEFVDLPFFMYQVYGTGVREYDSWADYAPAIKEMVRHIIDNGNKVAFPWDTHFPGLTNRVESAIAKIAGSFTPDVADKGKKKKKKKAKKEVLGTFVTSMNDTSEEDSGPTEETVQEDTVIKTETPEESPSV